MENHMYYPMMKLLLHSPLLWEISRLLSKSSTLNLLTFFRHLVYGRLCLVVTISNCKNKFKTTYNCDWYHIFEPLPIWSLSCYSYLPSFQAPVYFSGTTFTQKWCNSLDKIFCPTILSKMGINRKMKLEILHHSHQYDSCKIPTSWDIQGDIYLHLLIDHLQLQDLVTN